MAQENKCQPGHGSPKSVDSCSSTDTIQIWATHHLPGDDAVVPKPYLSHDKNPRSTGIPTRREPPSAQKASEAQRKQGASQLSFGGNPGVLPRAIARRRWKSARAARAISSQRVHSLGCLFIQRRSTRGNNRRVQQIHAIARARKLVMQKLGPDVIGTQLLAHGVFMALHEPQR